MAGENLDDDHKRSEVKIVVSTFNGLLTTLTGFAHLFAPVIAHGHPLITLMYLVVDQDGGDGEVWELWVFWR